MKRKRCLAAGGGLWAQVSRGSAAARPSPSRTASQAGELLAFRLGGLRRGVAGNRGDSGFAKEAVHPIARDTCKARDGGVRPASPVTPAGPGDFVFGPMGVPHAFLVTSERAETLITFSPAGTKGPSGYPRGSARIRTKPAAPKR